MNNENWETLATALDTLSKVRTKFTEWLAELFPDMTMRVPFSNANCANNSIGVVVEPDGSDVIARFILRGQCMEIKWGVCSVSSYFLVRRYGDDFQVVVDEGECDNPDKVQELVVRIVENSPFKGE